MPDRRVVQANPQAGTCTARELPPLVEALDQPTTLPRASVTETMVLLNVASTCTTPLAMFLAPLARTTFWPAAMSTLRSSAAVGGPAGASGAATGAAVAAAAVFLGSSAMGK